MDPVKTGALIAELRKEKQLTQLELAGLLSVSDKAVSRWETGRGMPDLGSLEALSSALDISVAELIRGEKLAETVPSVEVREISSEGLSMAKGLIRRRKITTAVLSVIISILLLAETLVFLNSPIYISWSEGLITPEISSDGRITAMLPEDAAGFETDTEEIEGAGGLTQTYVSCYRTLWSMLSKRSSPAIAVLGDTDTTGCVRYCPGPDIDTVIYQNPGLDLPYGTIHIPEYPFQSHTTGKLTAAVVIVSLVLILRKEGLVRPLWPLCPVIASVPAALIWYRIIGGRFYNKPFYHAGYLLLSTLLSVVLSLTVEYFEKRGMNRT